MSDELPAIIPPHSRAAEEAVLGAVLIDPECIHKLGLQPDQFYLRRNGYIWAAMQELDRQGVTPDYLTVCSRLTAEGRLGEVGGSEYIIGLINACPSSLNAPDYAAIIAERARRRAIIAAAGQLAKSAYDLDSDLQAEIGAALDMLSRTSAGGIGARPIGDYLSVLYDEIDLASRSSQDHTSIPTGFADWDRLGGLTRGEVLELAGDPGVGKSLLAFQVLANAARRGYRGALYQIEMSGVQVVRRALAGETHIPTRRLRAGKLTETEWEALTAGLQTLTQLPIYISDSSRVTTADIRADAQRLRDIYGLDMIVIDYEGLLDDPAPTEIERQNLISKRVKAIAKDMDVALISIGDMTKAGIQRQATGMGAHAGTGRRLHDRDQVATLKADETVKNKYNLVWSKNREGQADQFVAFTRLGNGFPMFADFSGAK